VVRGRTRRDAAHGANALLDLTSTRVTQNTMARKPFAVDVNVLESHSDTIDAFRTYYDTAAFLLERTPRDCRAARQLLTSSGRGRLL
jgi:hypothetical protein